jgi:hypothetical protein
VAFYEWVADVVIPELVRLATTLSRWQDEILAYHHTGGVLRRSTSTSRTSSGVARGSTNFNNYAPGSTHASARHGSLPPPPDSEVHTQPWATPRTTL